MKPTLEAFGIGISEENLKYSQKYGTNLYIYDRAFKLAIRDYSNFVKDENKEEK